MVFFEFILVVIEMEDAWFVKFTGAKVRCNELAFVSVCE
jgi:hypothetical protein